MKDLSIMTDEERIFYISKRKYAAEWRKKNPDKVKTHTKKFYLKQIKKSMSDSATSDME